MRKTRKVGKFKKVRNKSKFKDLDRYLDSIYRNNKEMINDSGLFKDDEGHPIDMGVIINNKKVKSKKEIFKQTVKEYMEEGMSADQALKKVSNSMNFTEYKELAHTNLYEALKDDRDAYRKFRELTKDEKGRFTKVDFTQFEYIGNNEYQYGNVIISFTNSPEEIIIKKVGD